MVTVKTIKRFIAAGRERRHIIVSHACGCCGVAMQTEFKAWSGKFTSGDVWSLDLCKACSGKFSASMRVQTRAAMQTYSPSET